MQRCLLWAILSLPLLLVAQEGPQTGVNEFSFRFQDRQYVGFLDMPSEKAKAIILLIPGSGKTDFLGEGGFAQFFRQKRERFLQLGYAVCAWDKRGCGRSEGIYEEDPTIEEAAQEAIAAIKALQKRKVPGADHIGLWGISRGGWICPLIISQTPSVAFWISVSGTSQYDNYRYLLETNFRLEGYQAAEVSRLLEEWDFHMHAIQNESIGYDQYVARTKNLYEAPFYQQLGQQRPDSASFRAIQQTLKEGEYLFDAQTGLRVLVPDFAKTLKQVKIPVLAILGEKDSQVDWRKTEQLYQQTIGLQSEANLQILRLSNCNHLMMQCETGAMFENLQSFDYRLCEDYYPSMMTWLQQIKFK